jgi:hypothetical protein
LQRWSRDGCIACSYDAFRLFSAYRSGAIAAVMDHAGNGSVMDLRGNCIVNIRNNRNNKNENKSKSNKIKSDIDNNRIYAEINDITPPHNKIHTFEYYPSPNNKTLNNEDKKFVMEFMKNNVNRSNGCSSSSSSDGTIKDDVSTSDVNKDMNTEEDDVNLYIQWLIGGIYITFYPLKWEVIY